MLFTVCSQVSGQEETVTIRYYTVQETAVWHLVPPLPQGERWRVSVTETAGGAAAVCKETVLQVRRQSSGLIIYRQTHRGRHLTASGPVLTWKQINFLPINLKTYIKINRKFNFIVFSFHIFNVCLFLKERSRLFHLQWYYLCLSSQEKQ